MVAHTLNHLSEFYLHSMPTFPLPYSGEASKSGFSTSPPETSCCEIRWLILNPHRTGPVSSTGPSGLLPLSLVTVFLIPDTALTWVS